MAGDSVIFMKKSTEDLYVGLRRTSWSISSNLEYHFDALDGEEFPISTRHKFAAESVLEAIKYAEMNHQFEVMYYPSAGLPEFVMAQKEVDTAMSVYWAPGMRVRMSIEAEDSAEMTWFQGTVSSIATKDFGPWPYSPWRMLKVTWDEPNILQNIDSINPWQVELVSATTQFQAPLISPNTQILAPFHALKRMRDGEELFEMADFKSKKMVDFFPPSYNYTTFPAGMQGARHDSTNVPGLLNPKDMSSSPILSFLYGIGTAHDTEVCTELNIRSIGSIRSNSPSEGLSSPRQESNIDSGIKIFRPIPFRPSKKVNQGSFQLFGQTYEIKKPDDTR